MYLVEGVYIYRSVSVKVETTMEHFTLWEFWIYFSVKMKQEKYICMLMVLGFLSFCLFWSGLGVGGVKKAVICTSDFKMFRISFTWQFPVDYSAIGLYMNMLFVVDIISFTKLSTSIVDEFFLYFILKYTLPVFYIFIQCKCLYVPFVSKCYMHIPGIHIQVYYLLFCSKCFLFI